MTAEWPIPPADIIPAQTAGRDAAIAGQPVEKCPHRVTGQENPAQAEQTRFLQLMWLRGYRHARVQLDAARAKDPDDTEGE